MVCRYQHRPAFELYNVEQDPYCATNLYGSQGLDRVTKRLATALAGWMAECGDKGQESEMAALDRMYKNRNR